MIAPVLTVSNSGLRLSLRTDPVQDKSISDGILQTGWLPSVRPHDRAIRAE